MRIKPFIIIGAIAGAACSRTIATLSPAPGTTRGLRAWRKRENNGSGRRRHGPYAGKVAKWQPTDLANKVTPILVELENTSDAPILVRYNRISLTDADGHRFAVMPPYDIDGTVSQAYTIDSPYYGFDRVRGRCAIPVSLVPALLAVQRHVRIRCVVLLALRNAVSRSAVADDRHGSACAARRRAVARWTGGGLHLFRGSAPRREDPDARRCDHRRELGIDGGHGAHSFCRALGGNRLHSKGRSTAPWRRAPLAER